jgi:hypothetical protein
MRLPSANITYRARWDAIKNISNVNMQMTQEAVLVPCTQARGGNLLPWALNTLTRRVVDVLVNLTTLFQLQKVILRPIRNAEGYTRSPHHAFTEQLTLMFERKQIGHCLFYTTAPFCPPSVDTHVRFCPFGYNCNGNHRLRKRPPPFPSPSHPYVLMAVPQTMIVLTLPDKALAHWHCWV